MSQPLESHKRLEEIFEPLAGATSSVIEKPLPETANLPQGDLYYALGQGGSNHPFPTHNYDDRAGSGGPENPTEGLTS